ncbi:RelA/SpoT domain-containing protein [Fluviicola taffensis]|uniref:RelA/SpoT domain-containing protein n=1 Tax=Fluviicola taffensis TaxID=191579 RepID=UPI0031383EC1
MNSREEELLKQFEDLRSNLQDWGGRVDSQIISIIESSELDNNFVKIPPSYRVKGSKSFIDKAFYRNKSYDDPMVDIEDKIGTRVVLLKADDIEIVSTSLLEYDGWVAKVTKSRLDEIKDKPSNFDYQSQHIVVFPKADDKYGEKHSWMGCEIQIRTLLQHAFAEVSHDSTYKGPYKNDKEIIRQLSKSMALMEATDDYFCNIFTIMSDQARKYSNYINELIRIYNTLGFEFERKSISFNMTEEILSLLDIKDVPVNELETFVMKETKAIKDAISSKNDLILNQPIILLINYYIENHRSFLEENWPLSNESLSKILNAFNYSAGEY